jgi:hypothetical protein
MFCTECGAESPEDFRFCQRCGQARRQLPTAGNGVTEVRQAAYQGALRFVRTGVVPLNDDEVAVITSHIRELTVDEVSQLVTPRPTDPAFNDDDAGSVWLTYLDVLLHVSRALDLDVVTNRAIEVKTTLLYGSALDDLFEAQKWSEYAELCREYYAATEDTNPLLRMRAAVRLALGVLMEGEREEARRLIAEVRGLQASARNVPDSFTVWQGEEREQFIRAMLSQADQISERL